MNCTNNYILIRQYLYTSSVQFIKDSKHVALFTSYFTSRSHTVLLWEDLKLGLKNAEVRRKETIPGKIPLKNVLSLLTSEFSHTRESIRTVELRDKFLVVLLVE